MWLTSEKCRSHKILRRKPTVLRSMDVNANIYMRTVNISGCVVDKFWGPINRNLVSQIKIERVLVMAQAQGTARPCC